MRTEILGDPVDVGVAFKAGRRPEPKWFVWRGRRHDVRRVEMTWRGARGDAPHLFFAVHDGTGVFELRFDQKTLAWTLEKTHVAG